MYGGFQRGPQLGPPDAERCQSLGQLPETSPTWRHYGIEGFKEVPEFSPPSSRRREPFRQPMNVFPAWTLNMSRNRRVSTSYCNPAHGGIKFCFFFKRTEFDYIFTIFQLDDSSVFDTTKFPLICINFSVRYWFFRSMFSGWME